MSKQTRANSTNTEGAASLQRVFSCDTDRCCQFHRNLQCFSRRMHELTEREFEFSNICRIPFGHIVWVQEDLAHFSRAAIHLHIH